MENKRSTVNSLGEEFVFRPCSLTYLRIPFYWPLSLTSSLPSLSFFPPSFVPRPIRVFCMSGALREFSSWSYLMALSSELQSLCIGEEGGLCGKWGCCEGDFNGIWGCKCLVWRILFGNWFFLFWFCCIKNRIRF